MDVSKDMESIGAIGAVARISRAEVAIIDAGSPKCLIQRRGIGYP
jgi:hypothetical protein